MIRFIIRRLLLSIPVLLGVIIARLRPRPGHPRRPVPGRPRRAGDRRDLRRVQRPLRAGPADPRSSSCMYLGRPAARATSATSIRFSRPVTDMLVERLPMTIELTLYALALRHGRRRSPWACVAAPAQLAGRRRHDGRSPTSASRSRSSCSGLVLAYVFAVVLKDTPFALPPSGRLTPGTRRRCRSPRPGASRTSTGLPRAILDFLSNIYTRQRAPHAATGRSSSTPSAT